jgi:rubrerythrin
MNSGALEMLATALEMEGKGMAFYEKAMTTCSNDMGRDVFTMLRDDEILHIKRIKAIYASLDGGGAFTDAWRGMCPDHKDLGLVFRELAFKHGRSITPQTTDIKAVDIALDFEQQSVAFYQQRLAKALDPLERHFLEAMVAEERSHFDALSDMRFYLSDPAAWFSEKEHSGFDGA